MKNQNVSRKIVGLALYLLLYSIANPSLAGQTEEELDKFLPTGVIQTASLDDSYQSEMLQMFINGLQVLERANHRGDVSFEAIMRATEAQYDATQDILQSGLALKGLTGIGISREYTIGPTKKTSRWAWDETRKRYDLQPVNEQGFASYTPDLNLALIYGPVMAVFDGTNTTTYLPDWKKATLSPGVQVPLLSNREAEWTLMAFGKGLISDFLLGLNSKSFDGRQKIGDVECVKVTAKVTVGTYEIWMSPEHGYRPMRIVRNAVDSTGNGTYIITEVQALNEYAPQKWYPARGRTAQFRLNPGGLKEWLETTEWRVLNYSPDPDVSVFKLELPSDTQLSVFTGKGKTGEK